MTPSDEAQDDETRSDEDKSTVVGSEAGHTLETTISELTLVLREETRLLQDFNLEAVKDITERKAALIEDYRQQLQALDPESVAVASELHESLSQKAEDLDAAAEENENALKNAIDTQERVFRAIASAVEKRENDLSGYDPDGIQGKTANKSGGRPININKSY